MHCDVTVTKYTKRKDGTWIGGRKGRHCAAGVGSRGGRDGRQGGLGAQQVVQGRHNARIVLRGWGVKAILECGHINFNDWIGRPY
jgi:hypothetical protein